jgi:CRISPR/Cas system endoribonuclease Cas6 (RAMP superfamily)
MEFFVFLGENKLTVVLWFLRRNQLKLASIGKEWTLRRDQNRIGNAKAIGMVGWFLYY